MRRLTRRECILIYLAVILIIVFAGYYFIELPFYSQYQEKHAKLELLSMEKKLLDAKLEQEPILKMKYDDGLKYYQYQLEKFGTEISNSKMEEVILGYLDEYKLEPISTNIFPPKKREYSIKDVENHASILVGALEVQVIGSQESFYSFLDKMAERKELRIISYESNETHSMSSEPPGKKECEIHMVIEYYMLEPLYQIE